MAPGSSLPDDHDTSVLALVTRLLTLEFERGKLTAQLEFHLRVRTVAAAQTAEVAAPPPAARQAGERRPRAKGELEREIIADLAKCGALPARLVALHVEADKESVRQTMLRLIREAKVLKDGPRYRLAPPPKPEPPPE